MSENKGPCYGCEKRHPGCQTSCPDAPMMAEIHRAEPNRAAEDYRTDRKYAKMRKQIARRRNKR